MLHRYKKTLKILWLQIIGENILRFEFRDWQRFDIQCEWVNPDMRSIIYHIIDQAYKKWLEDNSQ